MLNIYTSYFANLHNIPDNLTLFNIARGKPKFVTREMCDIPCLMPPWHLIKQYKSGEIDKDVYESIYSYEVLSKIDIYDFFDKYFSEKGNIVLLCWCKHDTFCHRYLACEWIKNRFKCDGYAEVNYHGEISYNKSLFDWRF